MIKSAVVVRAGRNSTHTNWMIGGKPDFDLFLVPYEELSKPLLMGATEVIPIPGNKVSGWSKFFSQRPDLLDRYDYIALLDDDLIMGADDINRSFSTGNELGLSLWQPSLSWSSYFSYAVFLQNPAFRVRFVNFIEMMCPFFSTDHLKNSLPLFEVGYETGIDRIWCRLRSRPDKAYAVLDNVIFNHTRPVGRNRGAQGFIGLDNNYQTVIDRMEDVIDLHFRGPVVYAGITKGGLFIENRVAMAAFALIPLLAWRKSVNTGWFYRPIVDHARHNLTRPIDNDEIKIELITRRLLERSKILDE